MENSSPLIFDISSEEELGFGSVRKGADYGDGGGGGGGGQFGDMDGCEWLSDLLVQVGGGKNDFSDDDVILVSDTVPKPPNKSRLDPLNPPAAEAVGGESDDDDCVVLDGDPYKPVAVEAKGNVDGGGDDDDVEIVAEKGEVACRDFPHARHLCAKFHFASTPHRVHCTQCHCYICDSLAPCSQWGTGISSIDHCHATDKDGYWKIERKRMKRGEKPASPVPIKITSPLSGVLFQPAQVPSLPQPVFRPVTAQSVSQGRPRPSGCAFRPIPVYKPPSQLLPVQSRSNVSEPSTGSVGASLPNNSHVHVPLSSMTPRKRRLLQQVTVTRTGHPDQQIHFMKDHNHGHQIQSYLPSHTQVYSQPYLIQTTPPPPPYVNSTSLMLTAPLPTHVMSQPGAGPHLYQPENYTPSETVSSYLLGAGNNAIGSELKSRNTLMPSSIQYPGSKLEINNQTSQPQARSDPSSLFYNLPSDFHQANHGQNGVINSSSNDFGLAWDSEPHGFKENDNRQNGMGPVDNNDQQKGVVIADNHSPLAIDAGSPFPESLLHGGMDFLFDNFLFENHPLPVVSEVPVSPLWNTAHSPEPAYVDKSNLFDFFSFGE